MAVTGLYSTGCPKQLWMVLFPGHCHPQKIPIVTLMVHSSLDARRHSSLRNSHSEQHAKQELEARFACAAWEGTIPSDRCHWLWLPVGSPSAKSIRNNSKGWAQTEKLLMHIHTCRHIAVTLQTTQVVQTCLEFTKRDGFESTYKDSWYRQNGRASSQFPTSLTSVTATRDGRLSESFQEYCLFCLKEFYTVHAQERPCHQQAFSTMKRIRWPYCKPDEIVLTSVLLSNTHEEGEMCPNELFSIWAPGIMSRCCGQGPCHDTEQGIPASNLSCLLRP